MQEFASGLQAGQHVLQQGQRANQQSIDNLTTNVNHVASNLTGRLDSMENRFGEFSRTSANLDFRRGPRGQFLPYIHHLFDGSTGNNAVCPVAFTDHKDLERELVVISLAATERFFCEECPNKIDGQTTRSFFTGPDFLRAAGLDYKDTIRIYLLTGFKFLAVGPAWNQERARNTQRVVIVEGKWYKQLLADIAREMPDRPLVRDFIQGGRSPNYRNDGVDYGFRQVSKTDKSTGRIVQISKVIPFEQKKKMVVVGEPWVRDWYTPFVADLFGIPSDMVGVRHAVSSVMDTTSAAVGEHRDAIAKYKVRKAKQEWKAQDRKKKRAAKAVPTTKRSRREPIL